jgi:septal ring factor EnvC (AmiA/AmiB activator)
MMFLLRPLFLAVLLLAGFLPSQAMAGDARLELEQIRQQRAELQQVRKELEKQLGKLGQELMQVDSLLVAASAEARQAQSDVRDADDSIATLKDQQDMLLGKVRRLKQHMQQEAVLAYRQAGKSALWLDMLFDARVADIPHRQYLLSKLVQRQQQDRIEYTQLQQELVITQIELEKQRIALDEFRLVKEKRQKELQVARAGKQKLWDKVRRDSSLKAERDAQLARQERALKKLLKGLGSTLLNTDNTDDWKPIRKLKGSLRWPINGRIVAGFHSPTAPGRASLAGVQLAPRHDGGQVKAIAAGQVRYADWFGGYGLMVIVDHGDGLMTVYAHNDALYKRLGDWVAEGDVIADPGSTGWVQKKRLYFEVRDAGRPVNPQRWCRRRG